MTDLQFFLSLLGLLIFSLIGSVLIIRKGRKDAKNDINLSQNI